MALFDGNVWHGAAWYPELWQDKVDEDLRLMREAGINLVRVGEFAWSSMEPREGKYDLGWLQGVLDKCRAARIGVVLCTPTPTPPRWLTAKYPDVLRVDVDGRPFQHGSRQHVSHTSPRYRRFSARITERLARQFGKHPALVAWQTDNEFLCHVQADYSPSAERAWHAWLKKKYGTVEDLNRIWATPIWSEDYPSFTLIPMPGKTPFGNAAGQVSGQHHVSLAADWLRFTCQTVVDFQDEQLALIRRHSRAPITHNHVQFERVFPEAVFKNLDFAATDPYVPHDQVWRVFRTLDWMRGAKMKPDGSAAPYFIMETSPSHNGSTMPGHLTHPDGFLPAEALIFLGHGGAAFCYWLWRQQRSGVEMCHGAVLTSWGTPSVGWKNVRETSRLIEKIRPLLAQAPPARAEIAVHESQTARALLRAEQLWKDYNLWSTPTDEVYRPLLELGLWRDVRFEDADVSGYKVVLSPFMPALPKALLARMTEFVKRGGTWIVGPMSGCRTEYGTVPTDAGLGLLDAYAGVKTLYPVGIHSCEGELDGKPLTLGWYCLALEPAHRECRVRGRYMDGPAAGAAWCVERTVGRGRVVLLTAHAPGQYGRVIEELTREVGLRRLQASWGTALIPREGHGKKAWLAANWDGKGGSVHLPEGGRDVLTGARVTAGEQKLGPFGMLAVSIE